MTVYEQSHDFKRSQSESHATASKRRIEVVTSNQYPHMCDHLDGNGRWAKSKGMPRNYGHVQGSKECGNSLCCSVRPWCEIPDGLCIFHRELEQTEGRSGCTDEASAQLYEDLSENRSEK